jgi:outer membrane protein assembly complex protein YaeT
MRRSALALVWGVLLALFGGGRTARAQDVECDPGDREVHSLDFVGNHAFSDDELALRIVTTASTWSRRNLRVFGTRRCLDSDELLRDKYRLQLLYRQAGYFNTKVDTLITPLTPTEVNVSFLIDEGQPVRITRLTITGLDSVRDRNRLLAGLWTAVGKPYNITLIEQDVQNVLTRLRNAGYPRPDVLRNYETSTKDSLTAHVALTFLPGPLAHIAGVQVEVTPNDGRSQEISDRIVRKLVGTGAGDLYREQALVDAQRNLYQTGAYRYVEVTPVIDSTTFATDSAVTLRVKLIEDYMRDLNTEFGWATLDCFRTRAQIVDKNFLGGAQRLELTGQLSKIGWAIADSKFTRQNLCYQDLKNDTFSEFPNYSLNATVRQPALFGTWATPSFSVYSEQHGEYQAFLRTTYIGGEASLLKQLGAATTLRLGYNVEYGKTRADPTLLCAAFSRCDTTSINQITTKLPLAIFSVATAHVATDNPINPTRGYVWRAESRNSATFLGSDPQLTFIKGVGDVAWYHPLAFGSVVAFRLRVGSIWGGATVNGVRQPPQQERLYAGGASSVRGFQQNELGALLYVFNDFDSVKVVHVSPDTVYFTYPHETRRSRRVVPVGGNTLFVTNLDYRVPSPFLPRLLQFTLFTDLGTVWNRNTLTNFGGFTPRVTPGLGVRVFTPLGPVQVNAGYNPYPAKFGPALFTPLQEKAQEGFTGVYCAVPDNAPPAIAPVATLNVDNGKDVWVADKSRECPATFQPARSNHFFSRLTFTFSIGPDF